MNHRNDRQDRRQIEARRANAEGRAPGPDQDWIKPGEPSERACLDILHGKTGLYPIFGIQTYVEIRGPGNDRFPALVYCDALYGEEGQNLCGALKPGFWVGVSELFRDPAKGYKDDERQLFCRTLLSQPEMQFALAQFREEQEQARRAARQQEAEDRAKRQRLLTAALQKLDAKNQGPANQPVARPNAATAASDEVELDSVPSMLTATKGSFKHDGLTIYVTKAPVSGRAVRIKGAPAGHPMETIANKPGIFARQDSLAYSDDMDTDRSGWTESMHLAYRLRMYLRGLLIASNVVLKPPVKGTAYSNGNGHAATHEEPTVGKPNGAEEVSSAS